MPEKLGFIKRVRMVFSKAMTEEYARSLMVKPWESDHGEQTDAPLSEMMQLPTNHVWVYRSITAILEYAKKVPLKVQRREPTGNDDKTVNFDNWVDDPDCVLGRLLKNPNEFQTWAEYLETSLGHLQTVGNGYSEKTFVPLVSGQSPEDTIAQREKVRRDDPQSDDDDPTNKLVVGLYPIQADLMRPLPDRYLLIGGYIFQAEGEEVRFEREKIIHWKYWNPESMILGMAPLQAALNDVTHDFWAQNWTTDMFKNSCRPEGIMSTDVDVDDPSMKRIETMFNQKQGGVGKTHKTMWVKGGWKYQAMSMSPKDVDFRELRKNAKFAILGAFGVPPLLAGDLEDASYSNAREQRAIFRDDTMKSKLEHFRQGLMQSLVLPHFGEDYRIMWDYDALKEQEQTEDERWKSALDALQRGAITANEARKRMGMPAYDDSAADKIYVSPSYVPLDTMDETLESIMPKPNFRTPTKPTVDGKPAEKPTAPVPEKPAEQAKE